MDRNNEKESVKRSLDKTDLDFTFAKARQTSSPFVFIHLVAEGIEEVIAIPSRSFDGKEAFYNRSYTNELIHVMNSDVMIIGLSYGHSNELDIML